MRFCALVLCVNVIVFAEAPITVSDLVATVTADFAVARDDKRTAQSLDAVRLRESLSDSTIDMLQQIGAGPETVRRLRELGRKSRGLPPPSEPPLGIAPNPSVGERAAMVEAMRRYAAGYLASLPDFICTREARQFHTLVHGRLSPSRGGTRMVAEVDKRWHPAGSYTAEATYVEGADHYRLVLEDNRPTTKSFDAIVQKVSWGEFAGAMKEVFSSEPGFEWDRWEVTGGIRTAVFTYYVDPAHSGYWLCCPEFTTGHRGLVYADPQRGAIRRIIIYATGLTLSSPVNAAGHVIDYAEVKIGGQTYLLPYRSAVYNRSGTTEIREDIDYRGYRKFGTNATVAFPTDQQPQAP